jgi:dienelactone hydrolase
VARRTALAGTGHRADGLSVAGGAPADQEAARDCSQDDGARIAQRCAGRHAVVAADPASNGKIGVVGFCYGGGLALRAAIEAVGVDCAVSFYGQQLSAEDTRRLKVPVLLHYAGTDERVNAASPISARRSTPWVCPTASTCTRARSTASTTIRAKRATTRQPPSWPGNARWIFRDVPEGLTKANNIAGMRATEG